MKTTIVSIALFICLLAPTKQVISNAKHKKEIMPLYKKSGFDLKAFLKDLSFVESRGNHKSKSKNNMLGKYQFKWSTVKYHLKKWNMKHITKEEFLNRPSLQDSVMLANLKLNEKILSKWIKKYNNKTVDGIKITKAGILAGAQFGPGTVIEFFERAGKFPLRDKNGVHVKSYMKCFSKYTLPKNIRI